MDPKFRSSFIPKQPLTSKGHGNSARRSSFNLLTFISTVVFLVAIFGTAGAFVYQFLIERSINQKGIELQSVRTTIEPEQVEAFKQLDRKLSAVREILDNHLAMTELFNFLEQSTLQSIQFDTFSHILNLDGTLTIGMQGKARSFSSLVLQSDIFLQSGFIRDAAFSNFNLDESGNVSFNVQGTVDMINVSYQQTFQNEVSN